MFNGVESWYETVAEHELSIQPREMSCPVPLTALQQRFWNYYNERGGKLSVRMCAAALHVRGPLDVPRLQKCIEAMVHRHESLRTRLIVVAGVPQQHVDDPDELNLEAMNLASFPAEKRHAEAKRLAQAFLDQEIDLTIGPLFSVKLWVLSSDEHVLVMALDHMVGDEISNQVLTRELWRLYHHSGLPDPLLLPALPLQFADYAVWQQRTEESWQRRHGPYWKARLMDATGARIPADNGLVKEAIPKDAVRNFFFADELSDRLRELGRREGVRLPLVVLTVYATVMSRWCGQDDLIVLFILHGRHGRPELKNVIGWLSTTLTLRIDVRKNCAFRELLTRVNSEFTAALAHNDFGRVCCDTELGFNWQSVDKKRTSARLPQGSEGRLKIQPYALRGFSPTKFATFFYEGFRNIAVAVHYRPDLLAPRTIERFAQEMKQVAEALVQDSSVSVGSVYG